MDSETTLHPRPPLRVLELDPWPMRKRERLLQKHGAKPCPDHPDILKVPRLQKEAHYKTWTESFRHLAWGNAPSASTPPLDMAPRATIEFDCSGTGITPESSWWELFFTLFLYPFALALLRSSQVYSDWKKANSDKKIYRKMFSFKLFHIYMFLYALLVFAAHPRRKKLDFWFGGERTFQFLFWK